MLSANASTPSGAATWGLLAAWVAHDTEELFTMAAFTADPDVPLPETDQTHVNVALALMGGFMATAAAAGARTGGRSPLYQAALTGFGLHAITHVASALALRRYTPGLVTAPLIVAPFSLWAARELRRCGVEQTGSTRSFAMFPALMVGVHLGAGAIVRGARAVRRRRAR
jgi:Protein of unknown function with HXXEE motif